MMTIFKQLNGGRVIIQPDEPKTTSQSGIILSTAKPERRNTGTVLQIGSDVPKKYKDARILFNPAVTQKFEYEGKEYSFIYHTDIIATL
jgi:co-chaperonin GroES (HSP10)